MMRITWEVFLFFKHSMLFFALIAGMKKILREWFQRVLDLLLPRTCIVCGERLLRHERHICLSCMADMPLTHYWKRSRNPMADRFNELIQEHITPEKREHYAFASALFFYKSDGIYREIPHQLKYHGNTGIGSYFGKMLGRKLAAEMLWRDVDLVIPVPLHRLRQWKRGYNQAEVIASAIASSLGTEMRTDILKRRKRTRTQTRLNVEEKARNVAGAFEVTGKACDTFRSRTDIRHILIVDDVFTTGSTLHACFTALRTVFPLSVRISVATLGFVGGG